MEDNRNQLWQGGPWERPGGDVQGVFTPGVEGKGRTCSAFRRGSKKRRSWIGFFLFLAAIVLLVILAVILPHLGGAGGDQGQAAKPSGPSAGQTNAQTQETTIPRAPTGGTVELLLRPMEGKKLTLQEIYEKNLASIVYIEVTRKNSYGAGSGVVLSEDGYIITNEHVIAGASSCRVVFHDDTVLDAKLVGFHAGYDLAVLKVDAKNLTAAEFGNSAQLKVGDDVVAIGNPLNSNLRGTMTEGIISAINRSVELVDANMSLIQTSAALNMGNSGGALINNRGQVVGITTMKMMSSYSTIEGLGFAIPVRFAKSIVDQIIATGEAKTPALGIVVWSDVETYGGLLVKEVHKDSDAWLKGLRAGDIIVAADGIPIVDNTTLAVLKEPMSVGDEIALTVVRNGHQYVVRVALVDSELVS